MASTIYTVYPGGITNCFWDRADISTKSTGLWSFITDSILLRTSSSIPSTSIFRKSSLDKFNESIEKTIKYQKEVNKEIGLLGTGIEGISKALSKLGFSNLSQPLTDAINKTITVSSTGTGEYSGTLLTSTDSANQVLDSYNKTTYRTVKYVIQAISGSNIHSSEVVLTHNDSDTFASQYAVVKSGPVLYTLGSTIVDGDVQLLVTPINSVTRIDFLRNSLVARTLPIA